MRGTAVATAVAATLLAGCVTPRLPAPSQEPFIWNDSAKPIHPLRADSARAAKLVVDYAEQIGLISQARCESSRRAFEVIISEANEAFQVVLVHRPEWCAPAKEAPAPQAGAPGGDRYEWAVSKYDPRLLRERTKTDLYRRDSLLYGPEGLTVEEQARLKARAQLVQQWQERFATRPAPTQDAFRTGKLVPGMSEEDFELLLQYYKEVGEEFEKRSYGERRELGNKKRNLWIVCKPSCFQQELTQQVLIQDGVVTLVQTGKVEFPYSY